MKERQQDKENMDRRERDSAVLDHQEADPPLTKAGFHNVLRQVSRKTTDSVSEPESKDSETSE